MASLNSYMEDTQEFLRDETARMVSPGTLKKFINRARREVALRTTCIRVLPNISNACMTATVVNGGQNYSATPTITISPPDFPSGDSNMPNGMQATAVVQASAGAIVAAFIQTGGAGYFQPIATITDLTGSGAVVTIQTAPINTLNQGQERYNFRDVDMSPFPGVLQPFAVQGISVIYANYRYSLPVYSFSVYQARIRQYPFQYQYVPAFASQFGQGLGGSFFVYPLPSQTYQYELDCYCLPSDLTTDGSVEALEDPYTEAVPYFAAHLSYLHLQNFNVAKMYKDLFIQQLLGYSSAVNVRRVVNPYGRY
jgi:hypothetical protein